MIQNYLPFFILLLCIWILFPIIKGIRSGKIIIRGVHIFREERPSLFMGMIIFYCAVELFLIIGLITSSIDLLH